MNTEDFPEESKVFQEYPKWVTPEGKEPLIVQDAEEELAVMGQAPKRRGRPPKE